MLNLFKGNKPLLAIAALGVLGISTYGIYNTLNAFSDLSTAPSGNQETAVTTSAYDGGKSDGTFCSPYGCAGCSGCVSLQYQQNVEAVPSLNSGLEIY